MLHVVLGIDRLLGMHGIRRIAAKLEIGTEAGNPVAERVVGIVVLVGGTDRQMQIRQRPQMHPMPLVRRLEMEMEPAKLYVGPRIAIARRVVGASRSQVLQPGQAHGIGAEHRGIDVEEIEMAVVGVCRFARLVILLLTGIG